MHKYAIILSKIGEIQECSSGSNWKEKKICNDGEHENIGIKKI